MNGNTSTTIAPPRIVGADAMLIFGLGQRYHRSNAGIPSQWDRYLPHLGNIPGQVNHVTYGVICNTDRLVGMVESVVMLGRADAGLSLPLRRMAIAHQAPTTLLVGEPGMGGKECLDLADRP